MSLGLAGIYNKKLSVLSNFLLLELIINLIIKLSTGIIRKFLVYLDTIFEVQISIFKVLTYTFLAFNQFNAAL